MSSMKKYIHRRNNLKTKYQCLRQKIERAIKNGRFYRYTKRRQNQLLKRLQSYYQRLVRTGKLALPVAGLIVGAASISQAQTFTLETTTASPFVNLNINPDEPFGLNDVGYSSTPTFVDIDGDGDLDAFVGEEDGNINYFENQDPSTGTAKTMPTFVLSTDIAPFGLTDVGFFSAPTFVDIDSDGDLDAFVGEFDGNINYFENTNSGTATSNTPVFSLLSTDGAFGLSDVGYYSTPTFIDIDGDGDLDAFIGEENGNLNYFENTNSGAATSNSPVFSLLSTDGAFGLSDVGIRSSPAFVDIDQDGDLDAFIGRLSGINYFENVNAGAATSNSPVFSMLSNNGAFGLSIVGSYSSPSFVDIDGDGDLDAFVGEGNGNINYFENVNAGAATSNSPVFVFPVVGVEYYSTPSFVDIDGDGDLDAFIGESSGNINYFENTNLGTATSNTPVFVLSTSSEPFGLTDVGSSSNPSFVDIDSDEDLDAFIGESNGNINYFENTSTNSSIPAFTLSMSTEPFGLSDIGNRSTPTFVDIDGDGDLDAFVGEYDGSINYFENTSTNSSIPAFAAPIINAFGLSDVGKNSIPTFLDIDADGDLDAFVGEYDGNINYFENTSTDASVPAFAAPNSNAPFGLTDVGRFSSPTLIDIDNDGLFEAVVGNRDGRLNYFESDIPVLGETAFNCSLNILPLPNTLLKSGSYSTQKSILSSSIIAVDSTVTFLATDSIVLKQGFHARAGSSFTASIGSCSVSSSDNEKVENRTEELSETPSTLNSSQLSTFPNPVGDQLFIKNAVGQARVLNMLGQTVKQFEIDRPIFTLDVSTLVSGQYILIVQQSNDAIVIQQFVK